MAVCIINRSKFLLLPDFNAINLTSSSVLGKQHADSSEGSGGSSEGSGGSSASSASSGGSPLFRVVTPKEMSDVSDGDTNNNNKAAVDDEGVGVERRLRLVIVYAEEDGQLLEKARICMTECFGFYTFAREIRGEHSPRNSPEHAHVLAPWAPEYWLAEYYAEEQEGAAERRVLLDPLKLTWAEFSKEVGYVVMMKQMGPEISRGLTLTLLKKEDTDVVVVWELTIPSFLVQNSECYRRVVHIYIKAYEGQDPNMECVPLDPEIMVARTRFLDGAGLELEYPNPGDSSDDYDTAEVVHLFSVLSGDYTGDGEVVEDDMEIEGGSDVDDDDDDDMEIVDEHEMVDADAELEEEDAEEAELDNAEEGEADGIAAAADDDDVESGGVAEEDEWNEFLARLARVEFTLHTT